MYSELFGDARVGMPQQRISLTNATGSCRSGGTGPVSGRGGHFVLSYGTLDVIPGKHGFCWGATPRSSAG